MVANLGNEEEMNDLRKWLLSLVEDLPNEKLLKIADAIEDAALVCDGDDPFYSEENTAWLKESIAEVDATIYKRGDTAYD